MQSKGLGAAILRQTILGADSRCQQELSWAVMDCPQQEKALFLCGLLSGQ